MLTSNSSTWELNAGSFEGYPHLYGEFEASLDWKFWLLFNVTDFFLIFKIFNYSFYLKVILAGHCGIYL